MPSGNQDTHKKYCDPGKTDIIERYRSLERIVTLTLALRVVVIPINAGVVGDERCIIVRQRGAVANQVPQKQETLRFVPDIDERAPSFFVE